MLCVNGVWGTGQYFRQANPTLCCFSANSCGFQPYETLSAPQEQGSAHPACGESSRGDAPAAGRNGAGGSGLLALCRLLGEGLSPLRRSCSELSLLRFTSEYGQPTNLGQSKTKEMTMHVFKPYRCTSPKQTYPSTNPETVRTKPPWEMLFLSFRCGKPGTTWHSHLREQAQALFLCNPLV